jgi:aspartate oxidase
VSPASIVSAIEDSNHAELDLDDVRSSLRSCMWINAGIERTHTRLDDACDMLDFWGRYTLDKVFETPDGWEVQNMLTAGALIARAALARNCSVGTHTLLEGDPNADRTHAHEHMLWSRGQRNPIYTPGVCDFNAPTRARLAAQSEPNPATGVSEEA